MSQPGEAPRPPGFSLASPISISSSSKSSSESEHAISPQQEEMDRSQALLIDLAVIRRSLVQHSSSPTSSSSSSSVSQPDYIKIESDSGSDDDRDTLSDNGSDDSPSDEDGENGTGLARSRSFLEGGDSSSDEEHNLDEDDNSVESEDENLVRSYDEIDQDEEDISDEEMPQDAEVANEESDDEDGQDEDTSSDEEMGQDAEVADEETDDEMNVDDNDSEDDTDDDENVSDEDIQDSSSEEAINNNFDKSQEDEDSTSTQSSDEHESSSSSEYRPDPCPPAVSSLGVKENWILTRVGSRISFHREWIEPPLVNDPLCRYPGVRLIAEYRQLGEAGIPYHGRFHTQVVMEKHLTQPLPFPLMTPRQILKHEKRKRATLDEAENDSDYEDGGPDGNGSDDSWIKSPKGKPASKNKKRAKKSHHANKRLIKFTP